MNSATHPCAYLLTLQQEHERLHITSVCRGNHMHDLIISLRCWTYKTCLTPPCFLFKYLYDFAIKVWNCSDSVVHFGLHFIPQPKTMSQLCYD